MRRPGVSNGSWAGKAFDQLSQTETGTNEDACHGQRCAQRQGGNGRKPLSDCAAHSQGGPASHQKCAHKLPLELSGSSGFQRKWFNQAASKRPGNDTGHGSRCKCHGAGSGCHPVDQAFPDRGRESVPSPSASKVTWVTQAERPKPDAMARPTTTPCAAGWPRMRGAQAENSDRNGKHTAPCQHRYARQAAQHLSIARAGNGQACHVNRRCAWAQGA